jgi:hypothetical protein
VDLYALNSIGHEIKKKKRLVLKPGLDRDDEPAIANDRTGERRVVAECGTDVYETVARL